MNRTELVRTDLIYTETVYTLWTKLPWQRKTRAFAAYSVMYHPSGQVTVDVSYFDYKTGKRKVSFMTKPAEIAAKLIEWRAQDNHGVSYSHQEHYGYELREVSA